MFVMVLGHHSQAVQIEQASTRGMVMWIFVDDVKRGAGYVKAYPVEQPDGDYDTDHLRLWIDSGLRAAHSDGLICDVLEDAIYEYATGAEQPLALWLYLSECGLLQRL